MTEKVATVGELLVVVMVVVVADVFVCKCRQERESTMMLDVNRDTASHTHTANSVLLALIEQLTTQESAVQQKNRTSSLSTELNRWQMRQSWWRRLQLPTKARALSPSPSSDVSVVFKVQAQFAFDDLSMKKKMVQSGRRGGGGKKGNRKRRRRWRWCDRNCLCERDGNRNLKWWMIDLCRRVRLCHTKCHW